MADTAVTITCTSNWSDTQKIHVVGHFAFTSDNYVTDGIVINFTALALVKGGRLRTTKPVLHFSANNPVGYVCHAIKGTTIANNKLAIYQAITPAAAAPLGQLPASAMPAALRTAGVVTFYAIFEKV